MQRALTCSRQRFLFDGLPKECQTIENLAELQKRECLVDELIIVRLASLELE